MKFFDDLANSVAKTEVTPDAPTRNDALCALRRRLIRCSGKVFIIGNGGSSAIASHVAVDFAKVLDLRAVVFSDAPMLTATSNDYGYDVVFSSQLSRLAVKGDILIAISSSGESQSIIGACYKAAEIGCRIITFTGMNPRNTVRRLGHVNFWVPSNKYGIVEIAHLALLHSMVDL